MLRCFFALSCVLTLLPALTLQEYAAIVQTQSYDILNLMDNETYAMFDVASARNRFDVKLAPASTVSTGDVSDNVQLGLQGRKRNVFGGEVYGDVYGAYNMYGTSGESYGSGVRIGYRQALWQRFGREFNTLEIYSAVERQRMSRRKTEDAKRYVLIDAARRFYNVLLSRRKIDIQKKSLARSKLYFEASEAKQRSGLVSKIDVYRAKISYLDQRKQLVRYEKQYRDAVEAALFLMGLEATQSKVRFEGTIRPFNDKLLENGVDDPLKENLLWVDLLSRESVLIRRFRNAKKMMLPDLTLDTFYRRYNFNRAAGEVFDWDESSWNVRVYSTYEFDREVERLGIERSRMQLLRVQRDKAELARTINKQIRELTTALTALKEDRELEMLKQWQAKASLDVARIRYERGLTGNLDLIDAENAYLAAQIAYISILVQSNLTLLEYAYATNRLNLERLKGLIR